MWTYDYSMFQIKLKFLNEITNLTIGCQSFVFARHHFLEYTGG